MADFRLILFILVEPTYMIYFHSSGVQVRREAQASKGTTGVCRYRRGFQGNTRVPRISGNPRNPGNEGFQGNTGPQGSQGIQGNTGAQGNQGFQGNTGPQGNTGAQGNQGNTGLKVIKVIQDSRKSG